MSARQALPARRMQKIRRVTFTLLGSNVPQKIYISAGYELRPPGEGGGRVKEVFLHGADKVGTERDSLLDKLAVMISLLLQFGVMVATLRNHLGGGELGFHGADHGRPTDVVDVVCDELIDLQREILAELDAVPAAHWEAILGDRS